ncbi:hypothetical protein, partial [Stenotrophomonas maltophilia]|uniref:hypothetical protein n=1 Tax=Stenotrophomonas maltophilia TaxID=40324 RepID=UPI00195421AE
PSTAIPDAERSLSAVTHCVQARARGFPLARHTVFFSGDSAAEFARIRSGRLPDDPTVYVCAQDRSDKDRGNEDRSDAAPDPQRPERLL